MAKVRLQCEACIGTGTVPREDKDPLHKYGYTLCLVCGGEGKVWKQVNPTEEVKRE